MLKSMCQVEELLKNPDAIRISQPGITGPLRMRHHAEHIAPLIADTCDMMGRTIGIGQLRNLTFGITILVQDLTLTDQCRQGVFIGMIPAFAMGDGNLQRTSWLSGRNDMNILADKMLSRIFQQGSREQSAFTEYLKSIAHT